MTIKKTWTATRTATRTPTAISTRTATATKTKTGTDTRNTRCGETRTVTQTSVGPRTTLDVWPELRVACVAGFVDRHELDSEIDRLAIEYVADTIER